jgi:hypothetical protein
MKLSALILRATATSRPPLLHPKLTRRIAQLLPKLRYIHAVLRCLPRADKNHRNVRTVAFFQRRILIDIHLSQRRAEFPQKRCNLSLGFLAQVTARPGVQRHPARPHCHALPVLRVFAHGFGFEYFWNGPQCG